MNSRPYEAVAREPFFLGGEGKGENMFLLQKKKMQYTFHIVPFYLKKNSEGVKSHDFVTGCGADGE